MILSTWHDFSTSRHEAQTGFVRGDVKIAGDPEAPVRRRVTLYREEAIIPGQRRAVLLECLMQQWSDASAGAYEFQFVPRDFRYTVVAHDHTGVYDPVIKAGIEPE